MCRAGVTKQNCPICLESLFYSRDSSTPIKCGHFVHSKCYKNMCKQGAYRCPVCLKSIFEMNKFNEEIDAEIENTPMPEEYKEFFVNILCNDCQGTSNVKFHVIGLKCQQCGGYNTRKV
jgi:RING finger/CHY zinc finger protein 1